MNKNLTITVVDLASHLCSLQDFEIPLDTETNGTTHVLARGHGYHGSHGYRNFGATNFRYDMGGKSFGKSKTREKTCHEPGDLRNSASDWYLAPNIPK